MLEFEPMRLEQLPPPGATWRQIEPFCLTFDGYAGNMRSVEDCATMAAKVMAAGPDASATEEIRIALFFWQRKAKWNDGRVEPADLESARACIEVLRCRLAGEPD